MSLIELYTVVVVHLGLIPAIAYPWRYRRSPWRDSDVGKALMTKGVTIAALFAASVIRFWWPHPGFQYVYALVVTAVVAAITYQYAVMRDLQGRPPSRRRARF